MMPFFIAGLKRVFLKPITAVAAAILLCASVFFSAAPLWNALAETRSKHASAEARLAAARTKMNFLKKLGAKRIPAGHQEVSAVLDEIQKHAEESEVRLMSLTTESSRESTHPSYRIMPVVAETRSTYRDLGTFLGLLDGLDAGLVTVSQFRVTSDIEDPTRVRSELVLHLYVGGVQ